MRCRDDDAEDREARRAKALADEAKESNQEYWRRAQAAKGLLDETYPDTVPEDYDRVTWLAGLGALDRDLGLAFGAAAREVAGPDAPLALGHEQPAGLLRALLHRHLEAQQIVVKGECRIEIGDGQYDVREGSDRYGHIVSIPVEATTQTIVFTMS